MSLVRALRGDRGEERGSIFPGGSLSAYIDAIKATTGGVGGVSVAGAATVDTAMSHPVVYRSVNKIAGIVGQLPFDVFDGAREVSPQPDLVADPAAGWYLPSVWKRTAVTSMLLHGGMSGLVDSDERPTRIDLVDTSEVDWSARSGWTLAGEPVGLWPLGPLVHVPLMTLPGSPKGVNPLEYARRTTYAGLAAQEFGGNFFRDGGHPTHVIAPEKDPGPEAAEALKRKVVQANRGNREPLVLPQSVKFQQLQINPDDSQFIDLMRFTGAELAGFFGLQPEHVGLPVEGAGIQYSNRENRQADLLQDAIMPVLLPIEEALTRLLGGRLRVKFNVDALLRPDLKARYESYEIAARIQQATSEPLLTVDEMRELENRAPLPAAPVAAGSSREAAEVLQKAYLGVVNRVITPDEAREMVNAAGGNLSIPGPFRSESED